MSNIEQGISNDEGRNAGSLPKACRDSDSGRRGEGKEKNKFSKDDPQINLGGKRNGAPGRRPGLNTLDAFRRVKMVRNIAI